MSRAVIIGGGISGLSATYYLAKAGVEAVLIEKEPRLGGVIQTACVNGAVIEGGPDSFLAAKPWASDLIAELGLGSELMGSNDHARVIYIWKRGRLVSLPEGLMMMVPTKIGPMISTRLIGWSTKIRMGLEWFRRPPGAAADRPVSDFIRAHYGQEAVDYLAEPLLAGVYGGSADDLSADSVLARLVEIERKYGSLTRGVLAGMTPAAASGSPLFQTLKRGMGQLTEALERAIAPRVRRIHGAADAIEKTTAGYRIRAGGEWIEADYVVVACRAYQAGALLGSIDGELAELLGSIPYHSSMTVALGYDRKALGHPLNGFGFLVPKRERRRLVACTWVGTKFDHRVPEGQALLRCFVGGEVAESDDAIEQQIRQEIGGIMGISAAPQFRHIYRWPRSMAQYNVGHAAKVARIEQRLAGHRGLHLAGNAYYGIGVPDCVRMGRQAAERIAGDSG